MKHSFDFLLLTETWLASDIKNSELLLSQYNVVRADRKSKNEKSKHGGCLIAVSNNVSFTGVDIRHLSEATQESLVVIKLNQPDPAVIALFYNPPKGSPYRSQQNDIDAVFCLLSVFANQKILFAGDFNLPGMDWDIYQSNDAYEDCFVNKLIDANFKQCVSFNTTKSSCLDLVLANDEGLIDSINRLDDLEDYFDHFPIQIEISLTSTEPQKKQEVYYSYCNCDFDYLNELIPNNPFDPYCYSSIDKNTDLWCEWIFHLIEKTTPRRTRRRQELPPWVSSETSYKLNKFRTLRRKWEHCVNFSPYLATRLIELEKHCANLQERDRQEYEEELISSRNRSRIFKYLKSFQKEKFPTKIVHLD